MKKKLLTLFLAAIFTGMLLAGCANAPAEETQESEAPVKENEESEED